MLRHLTEYYSDNMQYDSFYFCMASFTASLILMQLISPFIFKRYTLYIGLSESQKLEWNSRVVSSAHAAVVTFRALFVVLFKHPKDLVWGGDAFAFHTIAITTGYIVADLIMLMIYQKKIGGTWGIVIHHAITIQAYMLCLVKGYLVYFANYKLLAEASTVFLNLR